MHAPKDCILEGNLSMVLSLLSSGIHGGTLPERPSCSQWRQFLLDQMELISIRIPQSLRMKAQNSFSSSATDMHPGLPSLQQSAVCLCT